MTNVMTSTFILSTFRSFQVTYHLAIHMVFTFHSLSDMQDISHINDDFGYRHKLLMDRVLSQGYKINRRRDSF